MAFKEIHNSIGPNSLILMLLVFSTHFRIIKIDVPSSTIIQQATAMREAIDIVKQLIISC